MSTVLSKRETKSHTKAEKKELVFPKSKRKALKFINITQLLGALNDNVFKFLCLFLLNDLQGPGQAANPLSLFLVGSVYVMPFLLFSSFGGNLADRFSKQKVIISLKALEVLIMAFGIWTFYTRSAIGCCILLFLMATQSAFFGPSKYGIMPEIFNEDQISKANGMISSSTYLAIIAGSFLASFITQATDRNFVIGALICTLVAAAGFLTSLKIPKTVPIRSKRKVSTFVIKEIIKTISFTKNIPFLTVAIFGSSFFLFLGGFIQLNIVPYGMKIFNLTDAQGNYLFIVCSIGIALGSFVGGKANQRKGGLSLSTLACLGIALFFILIPIMKFSLIATIFCLTLLGFFGGLFVVPNDVFVQSNSPAEKRGQILGAMNFLSFLGVLIAAVAIYIISGLLGLSPTTGFLLMGALTFCFFIFVVRKHPSAFFQYASRKLFASFFTIKLSTSPVDLKEAGALVLHMRRLYQSFILMALSPKIHLYIVREKPAISDFFLRPFRNFHFIYAQNSFLIAMNIFKLTVENNNREEELPCLVIPNSIVSKYYGDEDYTKGLNLIRSRCEFVKLQKQKIEKRKFKTLFKLARLSISVT
jgi:acyl-[acyl-carrier-protein]-phospholipid O-acyltransferase/long-chain-fatty-acid--[acyl-carrier-protein] ligase